jgi:hypothetical protein
MTRWRGHPGKVAQRAVDAVIAGTIETSGNWISWIETVEELPETLREWIFQEIADHTAPGGVDYLKSLMRQQPDVSRLGV